MSLYEQKTIVLCQKSHLLNHAANCELFRKNVLHAKYSAKYSNPEKRTKIENI